MSIDNSTDVQLGKRRPWFNVLLLLDAFALGGLVVWRIVIDFLDDQQGRLVGPDGIGLIPHIQDKLLIYWLSHSAVSFLLLCITAGAYLWFRTSSRVVSVVPLIIPLVLLVWLLISRG